MTADRWNQVVKIFSAVADRDPDQQQTYLDQVCAHDPNLRAQVEKLLTHHAIAETEEFLKEPPWVIDELPAFLPDFEDYKQITYIGHGGMGVVYKAFDVGLDCAVALKMSLPRRLTTDEDISRFRIDPRSLAKLKHPNIVQVHNVGECEGNPYFTMNLIERKDDSVSLAKQKAPFRDDPASAARLMIQVARAVHHAHQRGILHLDIKPDNILLDDEDNPHITDFGLAKRIGGDAELTDAPVSTASVAYKKVVGTISYMSPEQADPDPEKEVTTLSDVYGLGATLYTLLTGRPPFCAETLEETLQLVRDPERNPEPIRQLNRDVSRDLEAVCLLCLKKDPDERYRSSEGLAKDLELWLHGKETLARRWSPANRVWRWCWRNPLLAGLAVTLLATFLLVTVAAASMIGSHEDDFGKMVAGLLKHRHEKTPQTKRLESFVAERAQEPELQGLLNKSDMSSLQQFCKDSFDTYLDTNRGHLLPAEQSLVATWFVVGRKRTILADTKSPSIGKDVSERDYVRSAFGPNAAAVFSSKVYKAESDGLYKYAIVAPVCDKDDPSRVLGLVAASVAPYESREFDVLQSLMDDFIFWTAIVFSPFAIFAGASACFGVGRVMTRRGARGTVRGG